MKTIALVACGVLAMTLSGCSSSSGLLSSNQPASIGGGASPLAQGQTATLSANALPSVVQADETAPAGPVQTAFETPSAAADTALLDADEEDLTPEERHRRELINRGDLEPGQPLPAE